MWSFEKHNRFLRYVCCTVPLSVFGSQHEQVARACACQSILTTTISRWSSLSRADGAFLYRGKGSSFSCQWVGCASKYGIGCHHVGFARTGYMVFLYAVCRLRISIISLTLYGNSVPKEICILWMYFSFSWILCFPVCYVFVVGSLEICNNRIHCIFLYSRPRAAQTMLRMDSYTRTRKAHWTLF